MNDHGTIEQPATPEKQEDPVLAGLEKLSRDQLAAVMQRAQEILTRREREERDKALEQIQKIAREHGLKVNVQDPTRKRGRPRKSKAPA